MVIEKDEEYDEKTVIEGSEQGLEQGIEQGTKVQFVDIANPSLVKDKIDIDNVVLTDPQTAKL